MRIVADTGRCVGAGQCVLTDPAVFDQDEDEGTVVLRTEDVSAEHIDRVREAVHICPSQALSLGDPPAARSPSSNGSRGSARCSAEDVVRLI